MFGTRDGGSLMKLRDELALALGGDDSEFVMGTGTTEPQMHLEI
jgi:hypothetical protein